MSEAFQIFSVRQIEALRDGGKILQGCLKHTASLVRPGITTLELDKAAETFIRDHGGRPAFKGYHGFPGTLCISVNDEVVHGIPGDRVLRESDVVSLDGGVIYDKLYTDACTTVVAGRPEAGVQEFLDTVSFTLEDVIRDVVKSGVHIGTISSFIQTHIEKAGYCIIKQLTGHGLGSTLHQFPDVPNWGEEESGPILPVNTMIAIEPIASMGRRSDISTDSDGWTIRTKDGTTACHFEHSVLITDGGCEIIA